MSERTPITIITGFLGAGKTTLLNHILTAEHGCRIAVIENEFGEAAIDNEILRAAAGEPIIEMSNGCICCTVREDLVRMLATLAGKRAAGALAFDRVVIETTGLADPAPIVQTFFADDAIARDYRLDGIVTVVDALHGTRTLDQHPQAQRQVGYADRLLVSKCDLAAPADIEQLQQRLGAINARAPIERVDFGRAAVHELFDLGGFGMDESLQLRADAHGAHAHGDAIGTFTWRERRALALDKVEAFLTSALETYGPDLLRYKGVLNVAGIAERVVFQGVHLVFGTERGRCWAQDEERESVLVFIGRQLPRAQFEQALAACVASDTDHART